MGCKVGIIGAAGTLGSCAAFTIATAGTAEELWLFDVKKNLLRSHFMDIQTAAAVLNDTSVHVGEDEDLAGCDIVVVAAGAPWRQISSRMELLGDGLPIVRDTAEKLRRFCPEAVVLTATNPVDPVNYAMHVHSGMDRTRLIGYTINDSYRFRMLVARALGTTATHVEGHVLGEHGEHQVPLFSALRVGGNPFPADAAFQERILGEIPKILRAYESLGTGRTSGWTSAVGLADMVHAIVHDSGEIFPCSVVLDGEYGRRGFSACVPARLGRAGVLEVREWKLAPEERAKLDRAFDYLEANARALSP
ncbi:MAG: malate dehydrogenase [Deltaproteobacteria bacterium]|nr:malate dehydrogenase [Deltaproteobacteria bacterium]